MSSRLETFVAATLLCAVPVAGTKANDGADDALKKLRKLESRRKELMAKLEPAVCAVMSLKRAGGGSGVIFNPRGWILTNHHVTGSNKVMKIGLPDGKFYLADVTGIDPGGDIAVCALRDKGPLPGGKWPHAELGDSDQLKIGGFAYAMGNPFLLATDFKPTMTIGIVSGLHRYQAGTGPNQRVLSYPDCIQVDTPINPGNSGGPLFDENGLLVGINGRITIRDRGRVNTGVGFAVSINQIKNFLPGLLAGEHTEHGTLDMNAWNMPDPNTGRGSGIFMQGTLEKSVVIGAGLQLGDKLTSFNGVPLRWTNDLARWVGVLPAGYEVRLGFQRYDPKSNSYQPERRVPVVLSPIETGSKDPNRVPNVPDWSEIPDWEKVRAEEAKKAEAAKKAAAEAKKKRAEDKKKGIKPAKSKKKKKAKKPPKRDVDREQALFRYMDGVVADLRDRLAKSLSAIDAKVEHRVKVKVARSKGGKAESFERTWAAKDDDFSVTERGKTRALSDADSGSDLKSTLQRERDLNPLLQPHRLLELMEDAWLDGGVFLGSRIGYVVAMRGAGKRAVYLDRDGFYPIGYRYRSFYDGGLREVRFLAFDEKDGMVRPTRAEVRVKGNVTEKFQIDPEGCPRFVVARPKGLPIPSEEAQRRIRPLFKSVVKIHGASGLKGIPSYGTGIIVSEKGHVLTWDHVSLLQNRCRVVFEDGTVRDYTRHRESKELGIKILKPEGLLDPKRVPFAPLELPKEKVTYESGTTVFSIGNSFKLAEFNEWLSVTFGVVVSTVRSDLRLNLRKFAFKGDVLIVDAPSNPGTHGGGLFTLDGKLIGLLTTLAESAETNTQLSLAVPAYELAAFVAQAIGKRKEATEIAAKQLSRRARKDPVYTGIRLFETGRNLSPPAYIDRVFRRSPAAKAKLRPDDMVVRINEFPIRTCAEFRRALRNFGPGEVVDITYKRGKRVGKVSLKLEAKK